MVIFFQFMKLRAAVKFVALDSALSVIFWRSGFSAHQFFFIIYIVIHFHTLFLCFEEDPVKTCGYIWLKLVVKSG